MVQEEPDLGKKKGFLLNLNKFIAKVAENWPAKVLSIALAMGLFVFHRMSTLTERFFSVPLIIESQTNIVPASSYPRTIRVTLRGDANVIYSIQEDDVQAYVDLGKYGSPGNYQAVVQIRKKGTALEVSPLDIRIEPSDIPLTLDYKISKFVPLTVNLLGEVEPGYVLNSYTLNPAQVIIDGPSRLISYVSELSTDVIDLTGRSEDFTYAVNILNRDPLMVIRGNGITEFSGNVSRVVSVRNIQHVPVSIIGLSDQFSGELETRTVTLHLEGRNQDDLDSFILPENFLVIDCSAINDPGIYMLQVRGDIPPGLIFTTDPHEMKVEITLAEEL
jgi:YbbR domain-containing protein